MLQIMFGQSKYYSDALSENVKRGIRTRLEKGWRSGKAPLGYVNDATTRTILPDPERFELVRQMFDLMLTGTYSPKRIWEIARNDWGFRTPKHKRIGGKPIALCAIYRILTSPFYGGLLVWEGHTYKGAHVPVVTIEEFERVQELLGRAEKPRPHHRQFAFTGLIRCGECNLLVTAEEKVNRYGSRYIYYHCTRRRQDVVCRQPSITEKKMENQIERVLGTIRLPDKLGDWAQAQLAAERSTIDATFETLRRSVRKALEDTERELATLISLRVRDLINDTEFASERAKLEQSHLRLQQQLERSAKGDATFEPDGAIISFSNIAIEWFRSGDWEAKRLIFDSVCSNPTLKDRILSVQAKKPFSFASAGDTFIRWCGFRENIRTLYANCDPELLSILDNIKQLEIKFGIRLAEGCRRAP
jgi:hypothetical protein